MAGLGARPFNDQHHSKDYVDKEEDEAEDFYIPPQSSRPFGAGIKRKRVAFVPSTEDDNNNRPVDVEAPSDISAKYLSIVLGGTSTTPSNSTSTSTLVTTTITTTLCPICAQPLPPPSTTSVESSQSQHESSITHQLALQHTHPPSHLDRQRKGLKYLVQQGWDPDARLGLGARGREGIRVPVRPIEKRDTAGLGLFSHSDSDTVDGDDGQNGKRGRVLRKAETTVIKRLNAKQVREVEGQKKKRAEKLRSVFYGEDLSRYLGPEDG